MNVYSVKLVHPTCRTKRVVFDATPDLIETRNVNYKSVEPVHAPGQIFVYGNTSARTFNISNAKLISRTPEEATKNLKYLQRLRAWCMPRFGQGSSTLQDYQRENREQRAADPEFDPGYEPGTDEYRAYYGRELLGAPPDIILLSAYSKTTTGNGTSSLQLEHIRKIPVVLQQLSIPYPSDVDYIPTTTGVPMPVIMTIDMTLTEAHSPAEYEQFSLQDFKQGILRGF